MLRALSVTAPVVASVMIVVLLVEPPALRPADRLPALRMFTARTRGLDRQLTQAAIAQGLEGEPEPYVLRRVLPAGGVVSALESAGVVYTPFLRIAWAAYASGSFGRPWTLDEVPAWMAAPVFYVALRTPPMARAGELWTPSIAVVPAGTATCCREPQPTLVRPLWVTDDPTAITRFGAAIPFSDLGIVAAYPIEALLGGLDVVAFHRVDGPDGPVSVEMRGRLLPGDVERWR